MRFKSLKIKQAGPLKDKTVHFKDVNLIVGNNEEGKTTLVDILVQTLFGKKSQYNKGLWNERFEFGGVEVATEGDAPDEDALNYSSLFVIREGDIKWQGRSSGKKEMLSMDMWKDDIREAVYGSDAYYSKISKKSVELAGVSAGKGWMLKLLANLKDLREKISTETIRVEEYKNNEVQIAADRTKMGEVKKKLEGMSGARKMSDAVTDKDLIERFFKKTDELSAAQTELDTLAKKNLDAVLEEWEALDRASAALDRDISGHDAGRFSREELKREKQKNAEMFQRRIEDARKKLGDLDIEKTKKKMESENAEKNYRDDRERIFGRPFRTAQKILLSLLLTLFAAGAVCGTLLLLNVFGVTEWSFGMPVLIITGTAAVVAAAVLLAVFLARGARSRKNMAELERQFGERMKTAEQSLMALDDAMRDLRKSSESDRAGLEKLRAEVSEMDNAAAAGEPEKKKIELKKMQDRTAELARLYHSRVEAAKLIEKRNALAARAETVGEELRGTSARLEKKYGTVSSAFLKEELKKLRDELASSVPDGEFNQERFEALTKEKDDLNDRIEETLRENVRVRSEVLSKIDESLKAAVKDVKREFLDAFYSDISALGLDGDIFNIFALSRRMDETVRKVEEDVRFSGLFLEALERMQSDIGSLVDGVVRTEGFRSALTKLTAGNYSDMEAGEGEDGIRFYLKDREGKRLEFSSLSTGTRNQVYFALRLALADRMFHGQKGVFILDDAFLTFDEGRRRGALELLGQYAAEGWQIVYSAVNEKNMESVFDGVFGKKLNKIVL